MISRRYFTLTVNFDDASKLEVEETLEDILRAIRDDSTSGIACNSTWDIESEEEDIY